MFETMRTACDFWQLIQRQKRAASWERFGIVRQRSRKCKLASVTQARRLGQTDFVPRSNVRVCMFHVLTIRSRLRCYLTASPLWLLPRAPWAPPESGFNAMISPRNDRSRASISKPTTVIQGFGITDAFVLWRNTLRKFNSISIFLSLSLSLCLSVCLYLFASTYRYVKYG